MRLCQNTSYAYILMIWVRCDMSQHVSRFCNTSTRREQRRVRASLLSSVSRAAWASFSQNIYKKVRQFENVPHRVYSLHFPKDHSYIPQVLGITISRTAARTTSKTKIATVGKHAIVVTASPRCRSQCHCSIMKFTIATYYR